MNVETPAMHILEPQKRSPAVLDFEERLRSKIIGQDEAVAQLVNVYQMFQAGMTAPGRPIANLLFLGPTGSGKTRLVEAAAEILFGRPKAFIEIDCARPSAQEGFGVHGPRASLPFPQIVFQGGKTDRNCLDRLSSSPAEWSPAPAGRTCRWGGSPADGGR